MTNSIVWLFPIVVGVSLTLLGCLNSYGFLRGIEVGHEKPFSQQLCGT